MIDSTSTVAHYIEAAGKQAWLVDGIDNHPPRRSIQRVGIIGAGTMGGGIAMNFATHQIDVRIVETSRDALDKGLSVVRGHYQRSADKGRFAQSEVDDRMNRLHGSTNMQALADCDLIIEAVFEDLELKKSIFKQLDKIAKPEAILATNTSALDINIIAAQTDRPQDVIGLHFFSPANVMKLLEIVRANHTADDVIASCMDLARNIGKVATLVGVCPGFVGNRILFARQAQAMKLIYQGVMPWTVDAAINEFGFRMGPFQMSDLAGLDIGWSKGAKTKNPIRDALCELDRRGQKTAAGYYDYDHNRTPIPSAVSEKVIRDITGVTAHSGAQITNNEIIENCVFPMINEGLKILQEGKAQRPSDIDIVWLNGYGWPADKGGPMYFADTIGAGTILSRMEKLAADDNTFSPAPLLQSLARDGGKFVDIDCGGLR